MKTYISPLYRDLLLRHGLDTFDKLWDLPEHWVEDPNVRRGGWSGTSRHDMVDDEKEDFSVFVKRQENHNYRAFSSLFRRRPTFFRELSNTRRLERIGVPTVEPLFYDERRNGNKYQAVLATRTLVGYKKLNSLLADPTLAPPLRVAILHRIAEVLQVMHRHRLHHNNMSGKHVLVKLEADGSFDLRILDLERMKRRWIPPDIAARDLAKFIRHTPALTPLEHAEVLRHYTRHWRPIRRIRLTRKINKRVAAKSSRSKSGSIVGSRRRNWRAFNLDVAWLCGFRDWTSKRNFSGALRRAAASFLGYLTGC